MTNKTGRESMPIATHRPVILLKGGRPTQSVLQGRTKKIRVKRFQFSKNDEAKTQVRDTNPTRGVYVRLQRTKEIQTLFCSQTRTIVKTGPSILQQKHAILVFCCHADADVEVYLSTVLQAIVFL